MQYFLSILVNGSRVLLRASEPDKDYINASFVDVSKFNVLKTVEFHYYQKKYNTCSLYDDHVTLHVQKLCSFFLSL